MATKPLILNPRGEYDARSLVLGDLATVASWTDVSPLGTNSLAQSQGAGTYQAAGGAGTPWSATLPAVRFDNTPQNDNYTMPIAFGGSGTGITLFVVGQATNLIQGQSFWGSPDGINPPVGLYLFISTDGSVWFMLGRNGAQTGSNTRSVPGIVQPGDRFIITARRLDTPQSPGVSSGPTIIRVNGVEVASSLSSGWLDFWFGPRFSRINIPSTGIYPGPIDTDDGLVAHALAFQQGATDQEILDMEAWLSEIWGFDFLSKWFPAGPQPSPPPSGPAVKPTIADPEIELDARTLPLILSDGDPVLTWADQSGNANDAIDLAPPTDPPTVRFDRWAPGSGIPSVEFLDAETGFPPDNEESMGYTDSTVWAGQEVTLFIVGRIIDLSSGGAFIGSQFGGTPPREMDVCVFPTGEILWGFGTETIPTAVVTNIITAPGTVVEGEKLLITVRSTNGSSGQDPEGMLIRLNGEQVASVPSFIKDQVSWSPGAIGRSQNTGSPELGLPGGTIWGKDRLIAWIGGYSRAATNAEILDMERFLHDTFGFDFLRKWTPEGTQVNVATAWTAPGAASGEPFLKNNIQVGFTDFSEFAVASGQPAGITAYGGGSPSPGTNAIANDVVEGNYFTMFGQGFQSWGFGLDSFFGLMDSAGGELLARVWLDTPVNGRKLLGPAANMEGTTAPTFDNWSGGLFRLDPDELSGLFVTGNGSSSTAVTGNTQEAWQDGAWVWVRARRVPNATLPATQDDFFVTAWFGDLADEPASVDGSNIGQPRSFAWLAAAIGWAMPGNAGAETEQRIAFLSFSADPLLAAPPVPGEQPSTLWTPNP